jgi:hypothetical protein
MRGGPSAPPCRRRFHTPSRGAGQEPGGCAVRTRPGRTRSGGGHGDERQRTAADGSTAEGRRPNRGGVVTPGGVWGETGLPAQAASGRKAAGRWSRLLCGTWAPVAPMARETRPWRPHEWESPEAGHRGGVARRREAGAVRARERRGDIVPLDGAVNQHGEDPGGESNALGDVQAPSLGGVYTGEGQAGGGGRGGASEGSG